MFQAACVRGIIFLLRINRDYAMEQLTTVHSIPALSSHLCGLAWENGSLWYSDGKESGIYRLEPQIGKIRSMLQIPQVNTSLSFDGGYLGEYHGAHRRPRGLLRRILHAVPAKRDQARRL